MQQKMYYTVLGYLLIFINITLIDTRFNLLGIGFGVFGAISFLKALSIRK